MLQIERTKFNKNFLKKGGDIFQRAELLAVRSTMSQVRTLVSREILAATNLKKSDLAKTLRVKLPTKASVWIRGILKAKGKKFPLYRFMEQKPDKERHTFFESEFEKGKSEVNVHAFLAIPTRGKNTGIRSAYVRQGGKRYPIRRLFSPSLAEVYKTLNMTSKLNELVRIKLKPEYYRLVNLFLKF